MFESLEKKQALMRQKQKYRLRKRKLSGADQIAVPETKLCVECSSPTTLAEQVCAECSTAAKTSLSNLIKLKQSGVTLPRVNDSAKFAGNVYFIQAENGGPIKIGFAGRVPDRLAALQTSSPYRLQLIGVVRKVTQSIEVAIHKRFQHLRLSGEWFRDTPELLEFIKLNPV